jgi:predicted Zn-dependent protease
MQMLLQIAPVVLALLLSCSTQSHVMDISKSQVPDKMHQDEPFEAPSFYAKWKKPVDIHLASNNADLYKATEHAIAEINQAVGFDLLILKGIRSVDDSVKEYKGWNSFNSIMEVPDQVYLKVVARSPKSLAVTKLMSSKDQLYEADILVRSSTIKSRYLQATILHELGHVVGLGHSRDRRSFMYPELRNPKRYVLGQEDARVLSRRYASSLPVASSKRSATASEQSIIQRAR